MDSKTYKKMLGLLKFVEFISLGFLTYYVSTNTLNINITLLLSIYILLFLLWFVEFYYSKLQTNNLDLLIKQFYELNHFEPKDDIRITIHKKLNDKGYRQFIDYYPHGSKRGKKHEIKKGLVKYAFKKSEGEFSENFASVEEKIDKLLKTYNFRKEEAEQQVKDGELSYYCCPIMKDEKIWGVLYMNSKRLYTFPKQSELTNSNISKNVKVLIKMIEDEIN